MPNCVILTLQLAPCTSLWEVVLSSQLKEEILELSERWEVFECLEVPRIYAL
jgi:hypothetical protein